MQICRKNNIVTAVVAWFLLAHVLWAASGSRNLALNKKLEYAPKPEYPLTVHPRDTLKLTDGVKDESLWYEKYRDKTVGWVIASLVEITIDLGQISDVGFINIHTVGGGRSGVEYPEYVIAVTSLDTRQYAFAGFAASDGWDFGVNLAKPKVIKLAVEQKARYIKLFVRPVEHYFFTDEIEVIKSDDPGLDTPRDYLSKDQTIDLVERVRQLQRDMESLKIKINGLTEIKTSYQNEQIRIETAIAGLMRKLSPQKVSEAESLFNIFRGKVLSSQYNTDWLLYRAEPMDILRYGDLPTNVPDTCDIFLYQWQNEYGVAALNLVNCSGSEIMFKAGLSPLRMEDRAIDSKDIFEIRRALYVRVLNAGLVADPLVLQNAKPFPVLPGQTVQLWIETCSKGLDAGEYTGALAIEAVNHDITKKLQAIPLHLKVAEKIFPDKLPFDFCSWDYITISDRFTGKNPTLVNQAAIDLKNHYMNVLVVHPGRIYDNNKIKPISYNLREELAIRSDTKPFVLFFLGGKGHMEKRFGSFRSPNWQSDFNYFLMHLRDFMLSSGFDYDSFALYPFDESIDDDFVYVAQKIRNFDPRLKIYANKWIESPGQFTKVKDLIDIWCPHIPDVLENKVRFDQYKSSGVFDQIWCYHANIACERYFSPPKSRTSREWQGDNKTFWRTMPIVAASLEMTGAGFWVYQDANRAGWIKDKLGEHGVIYNGTLNPDKNCFPEGIVPSRRWQQWRQGVEDAVCLYGHKDLLSEFSKKPVTELNSEYLITLRKRADEKNINLK